MNAEEFIKNLERDSTYQAMLAEKQRRRSDLDSLLKNDEAPLVDAIAITSGVRLQSVWELVNSAHSYSNIIELLADHITHSYHFRTREAMARALTVKEARGTRIPRVLIEELKKLTNPQSAFEESYRLSLVNALMFVGDRSLLEEVRQIVADERFGAILADLKHLIKVLSRKSRTD